MPDLDEAERVLFVTCKADKNLASIIRVLHVDGQHHILAYSVTTIDKYTVHSSSIHLSKHFLSNLRPVDQESKSKWVLGNNQCPQWRRM